MSISRKHLKVYWYGFTFKTLIFFFKHDILFNLNASYINNVQSQVGDSKRNKIWLPGASTRDPIHDKVIRRRPDKRSRSGPQGFRKAAPALTLKDGLCLSDACYIRLLPNFCESICPPDGGIL